MNKCNSVIQNSHLRKSDLNSIYAYMEKGASDYAVKVGKRKPYETVGKEKV
jgi:hypothetical protein